MLYYLQNQNGKKIGPLSEEELKDYDISETTFIWREGYKDWVMVSDLPESDDLLSKIPPPDKPKKFGCGFYIACIIISIPISMFVPFLWIVVAFAVMYILFNYILN